MVMWTVRTVGMAVRGVICSGRIASVWLCMAASINRLSVAVFGSLERKVLEPIEHAIHIFYDPARPVKGKGPL